MNILGIETSCDETAAAVWLKDRLGSNVIASQEIHSQFGGVVPELASRAHVKLILPIVKKALANANIKKNDLDGIAVTYGPGLSGSLLVGLNFAKALSFASQIPLVGINHIEGHIFSNSVLKEGPGPPFISLIISGGHTQLVLVEAWSSYKILGKTRDDAVGEAFDKTAKMLDLEYPGGPAIDRLAKDGDPNYVDLPRARFKDNSLDFSYSGLKTAVLYYLQGLNPSERQKRKADVAASFQTAALDVLIKNSLKSLQKYKINQLAIAGGVACNSLLRRKFEEESESGGFKLFIPPVNLCTDNAAMIARAGLFYLQNNHTSSFDLSPKPSLSL